MMVSGDGLLIAAQTGLGHRAAEEAAAAVIGNLGRTASTTLERLDRGDVERLVMSGVGGRAALSPAGGAFLVVLLEADTNLGLIQLELGAAANEAARKISL